MVKYFSVDWLVQSHPEGAATETAPPCKPHVPCMLGPRQPVYGKGYLQPKPKPSKSMPVESSGMSSPSARCASPISETSGYSSGYDSEAASSECPSVDEAEKEGPQRRVRTKFTPEQINRLVKIFDKHKYLDAGERVKIAHKLDLTETQVRTWFQNRRMKLKREVQDLAPQVQPVMFQHLVPAQYHPMAGQQPHHYPPGPAFYPVPVPQLVLQPQLMIHKPHFY
uniref:homeobox protein pv.1-like n=1 Tax=Doryrhamphus excisus TaxID=161450 RepID=UPI0025AE6118|nr:homeobox protein pv.1-like [Doryrhamphus excisus]